MAYEGLVSVYSDSHQHLGGNIKEGDPFTFCPKVWEYAIDRFGVRSVLDLGSGLGYSSKFFFDRGRQVIAIDGLDENVRHAIYPTVKHDLTHGPIQCVVDLVHCQEVVEHIDAKHLDNLLQSLACGKFILMTHAVPGQGGHHHVNEQPSEYWIEHLQKLDCALLQEDTKRIRELAKEDGAVFMAHTGMLFANRSLRLIAR
jgi:hypothetical protein